MEPTKSVEVAASAIDGGIDTNELVRQTQQLVEGMEHLKEDARKLYRFMKRSEMLVSDLRPYSKDDEALAASLVGVERELAFCKTLLEEVAAKGKMSSFMQADHILDSFTAAAHRIEAALGQLPIQGMESVAETAEDVATLRSTLQRMAFGLPSAHQGMLKMFRAACDAVKGHAASLEEQCHSIIRTTCGDRLMSRSEYTMALAELQKEIRTLRAYAVAAAADAAASAGGDAPAAEPASESAFAAGTGGATHLPGDSSASAARDPRAWASETKESAEQAAFYLRVLLDVIKVTHDVEDEAVPLEFVCPLSTLVMQDPVVLFESGHSFERSALTDWWANGHRMCPKTGIPLKAGKLLIAPNVQLKEAIHRWSEAGNVSLRFRPLLRLLSTASDTLLQPTSTRGPSAAGEEGPSGSGRLETLLGAGSGVQLDAPAANSSLSPPPPQVPRGGGFGQAAVQASQQPAL